MTNSPASTPAPSVRSPAVSLYLGGFLAIGMTITLLGPSLSTLRDQLGTSDAIIGRLFVAQSAGYIVGARLGGFLYDRLNGHRVFGFGLTLAATALFIIPHLRNMWTLAIAFLAVGVGALLTDLGGNVMLMWRLGDGVGRAMNLLHMCFAFGAIMTPFLVSLGVNVAAVAAGLVSLLIAGLAQRVAAPRPPKQDEALDDTPVPRLALMALFFVANVGLEASFAGWIHTYAGKVQFDAFGATVLTSGFWIAFLVARMLSSAVASSVAPRTVLIACCSLAIAGTLLIIVARDQQIVVWIATLMLGLAISPQFPVMLVYLERRIKVTGRSTSWFIGGAGLGGLVFPFLVGIGFDRIGVSAFGWSILLLATLGAAVLALLDNMLGRPQLSVDHRPTPTQPTIDGLLP